MSSVITDDVSSVRYSLGLLVLIRAALTRLKLVWDDKNIAFSSRICLIMDPRSRAPRKNTSQGNKVLPQLLHISYKYNATNEEVYAKIQQAI